MSITCSILFQVNSLHATLPYYTSEGISCYKILESRHGDRGSVRHREGMCMRECVIGCLCLHHDRESLNVYTRR